MHPPALRAAQPLAPQRFFGDVWSRRALLRLLRAEHPGVRFSAQRSWTSAPRPRSGTVGAWWWSGSEDELRERANEILLHLVYPLVAGGYRGYFAAPFSDEMFTPRRLTVQERGLLDLEDLGSLWGVNDTEPTRRAPSNGHWTRGAERDPTPLAPAQRAAAEHGHGPARVLAPAGAGKTKTIVARVHQLLARGIDPGGILVLAFNRKAAEEFEERLMASGVPTTRRLAHSGLASLRGGGGPGAVHCATFNAFGSRYLREIVGDRGRLQTDERSQRSLLAQAIADAGYALHAPGSPQGNTPLSGFLAALTAVRSSLISPEHLTIPVASPADQPVIEVPFSPIHAAYLRRQQVAGCRSFDDQIYFTVADLLASPTNRCALQRRFQHILVDEFQDLNGAQLALIDILSRPHRNLFVVGDDDQLIYGWRRAEIETILGFHRRMPPEPFSTTYTLPINYRCARSIVEASSRLVAANTHREHKPIRPREGAPDGAVHFVGAPTWPERAEAVQSFVQTERSRLGCAWRDLAVLCRYRSQQLPIALALDEASVPRSRTLGCRIFTHPSSLLLRAHLALLRDPHHASGDHVQRAAAHAKHPTHRNDLVRVRESSSPWRTLLALAESTDPARSRPFSTIQQQTSALTATLAELPQCTASDLIWTAIDGFELEASWEGPQGGSDEGGALEVLDALLRVAESFPDPASYLATWDRLLAEEKEEASGRAVQAEREDRVAIGTIHAAKGREYHAVVLPDYDCDLTRLTPAQIEEERRVVYVGVTRARHSALLTLDTSQPYRHPFLRELIEPPEPSEPGERSKAGRRERLTATLQPADHRTPEERLALLELLYPELFAEEP